jgi:hypothetical protein
MALTTGTADGAPCTIPSLRRLDSLGRSRSRESVQMDRLRRQKRKSVVREQALAVEGNQPDSASAAVGPARAGHDCFVMYYDGVFMNETLQNCCRE